MAEIRVERHFRENAMTMNGNGEFTEVKATYIAAGTNDEGKALQAVHAQIPEELNGLPLDSLEISGRGGEDVFIVEAAYKNGTSSGSIGGDDEDEPTVGFDCGGGTMHLTHSYSQRRVFGDKDAGGAIGWNGKSGAEMSISGIDVPTAQLRETYTRVMRLSRISTTINLNYHRYDHS